MSSNCQVATKEQKAIWSRRKRSPPLDPCSWLCNLYLYIYFLNLHIFTYGSHYQFTLYTFNIDNPPARYSFPIFIRLSVSSTLIWNWNISISFLIHMKKYFFNILNCCGNKGSAACFEGGSFVIGYLKL